ncbi:MAG: hypothetical protein ONB31_03940 [candidate division KSB1 bacterium]|nr:hypothetical protein [candidate division KSB1 bacterium]MDZ7333791.1 hypothetical protein [candidate division KSB1 bacterium]MDZ7400551.1 hypothetical protein [candidate division KSB1 bacterium]
MIIKDFFAGRQEFVIARQTHEKELTDHSANYAKRIEMSLALSLLIALIFFQLFPSRNDRNKERDLVTVALEMVEIPVTKQEPPPPPPPVQEMITDYSVVIKNNHNDIHQLREELEDVTLELEVKPTDNLLANSQLDNFNYAMMMRNRMDDRGASLDLAPNRANIGRYADAGLTFDPTTATTSKKFVDTGANLDSPPLSMETSSKPAETKPVEAELIPINRNQFLLRESESTIGTSEYRLWNKINAALDRLDKNRFGKLPENVQRSGNGLIITLSYSDGVIHEIFWTKGGKVVIRVTGNRPQQQILELQKALDALIQLTLL